MPGHRKTWDPPASPWSSFEKILPIAIRKTVPVFLRYSTHIAEGSMYNTPNTWGIYMLRLTCDWMEVERRSAESSGRSTSKKRP